MKLINPLQKYPHITESYPFVLKIFDIMFLLLKTDFFWNALNPKAIKVCHNFGIYIYYIYCYPMSFNIRIVIKINYILFFITEIISRINPMDVV